ncbi:MAG: VWA domain-containing protein [Proteobacteria bacterium]|nr:VWA domain-containing protein [Pseudomonadota bacterium]
MEEWVGARWHRLVTRLADAQHPEAAVALAEVQPMLGVLFRAGGGAPAVRIASAAEQAVGGRRTWLQRVAGTGLRAARAQVGTEVLALPERVAVFAEPALNRALYLWLAALAAHWPEDEVDWLRANCRATQATLAAWPGLRARHAALVATTLTQRGPPQTAAEAAVQAALRGEPTSQPVRPAEVAPVWLWLETAPATAALARDGGDDEAGEGQRPSQDGGQRRRAAQAVQDQRQGSPLVMMFRAESLLSWGEFIKLDRASDDEDDGNAVAAADDMDQLAITQGGQTLAARVKFDLDLPSAAHDDAPLGEGQRLPEWDWRRRVLLPDHCAVQVRVAREAPPFVPTPALARTAQRIHRRMAVLRPAPALLRRQEDGDAIDLDAWVDWFAEGRHGPRSDSPPVYLRRARSQRSLATLLLADLSLSTDAHVSDSERVIDVIRDALYVFGEALAASGDAFEMLGFSSVRRQHVRINHLKGFGERWDATAQARVGAIKPGYYTRMGAAIRHATARLAQRPERQRLLLILTDGKPSDLDHYEGRWGLEDTRHALAEARREGLTPFAVSIDAHSSADLPRLFGVRGHAFVRRPHELVQRLALIHADLTRSP